MKIDPKLKVAEIARLYPKALPVFAKYKLDLCCGGVHPLEFVAQKHGLDLARILQELDQATS